jgi:hypothetical protein
MLPSHLHVMVRAHGVEEIRGEAGSCFSSVGISHEHLFSGTITYRQINFTSRKLCGSSSRESQAGRPKKFTQSTLQAAALFGPAFPASKRRLSGRTPDISSQLSSIKLPAQ